VRSVETVAQQAHALLVAVHDEARLPPAQRPTHATDEDLNQVAAVLHAVVRPDQGESGTRLAGLIGRTVTDRWSLTAALSERLVNFDQRLRSSA
jgi:hypothetical protein